MTSSSESCSDDEGVDNDDPSGLDNAPSPVMTESLPANRPDWLSLSPCCDDVDDNDDDAMMMTTTTTTTMMMMMMFPF